MNGSTNKSQSLFIHFSYAKINILIKQTAMKGDCVVSGAKSACVMHRLSPSCAHAWFLQKLRSDICTCTLPFQMFVLSFGQIKATFQVFIIMFSAPVGDSEILYDTKSSPSAYITTNDSYFCSNTTSHPIFKTPLLMLDNLLSLVTVCILETTSMTTKASTNKNECYKC